ncbi:non-ribosomal peptide synthetase [Paraburkholderia domus]|uniref:Linear gramicidin synthase subunit D n=1 Tax=Paraburkholderia domus TaxID=2793075 RepID=A0A9N8MZ59_9BURK|nr:non-ribosomal peptide synthetase [Paraburkholderia domus]MBK5121766.1 amino acid adenylation domain-containing protein [Burkholderia sp. R-69980]MBK5167256.1 amino acid adenylation domain-containing protein [Burkholderia sp. R-70211]CAE6925049.1 Linear gramicidin synthase subunit D [Paraburkholderia domus]
MEHSSFALTRTQSRTLAHAAAGPNLCAVYRIDGRPDVERLSAAVAQLVQHCRPLAYRLVEAEQGMRWVIRRDVRAALDIIDLDRRDARDEAAVLSLIDGLCARAFRMDAGLPWAFTLLGAGGHSYLVFACHPVLLDRFSLTPLFKALSRAYRGESPGAPLGIDQQGLLDAERELLASDRLQNDLDFWIGQVGDTSFEWHAPRRQNALADSSFTVRLDGQTGAALRHEARALGVELDVLIKLFVHVLLRRMTGSRAVLTAHHQRGRCRRDETIGFDERRRFLRTDFDDTMTLRQFLRHAAARAEMGDFHTELPAFEVLHDIERREPGFVRATNVVCETDSLPYDALALDTLPAALLAPYSRRFAHEDMGVYLDVREEIALHVHSRYPQELDGLRLAFEHLTALLARVGESLEQKLEAIDLYTPVLRQRCAAWSDGGPLAAPARDVLDLFAQTALEHGARPAVSGPDAAFTYAQLALAAQRVGAALAALEPAAPAGRDTLIGICISRGARIVPAMLGVHAIGAGYLPLDPQMPDERLRYIVKDAQLRTVIVDAATHERLSALADCALHRIEDLLKGPAAGAITAHVAPADPQRTAYVIYTSGTTGKPKGVVIERGMLAHLIASLTGRYRRDASTRWLQFASVNFDASVLEIFNPLTHGGHLIVAPGAVRTDADALFGFLNAERITHAFLPPAILKLLPRRALPYLETVLCGGEASDDETIRFWSGMLRLSNIYGPTETTVMATENTFDGDKPANQLGHPLPGYQIHLLDEEGEAVPLGGIGEICIGGAAVSRGYLLRPELTGQKFRVNPFGPGRLYRSGDLGRFQPDGAIEFLGRSDFQVKIRGYRIELGEIEASIVEQPEVRSAYVGTCERQGGTALVAWYVGAALEPAVLRSRLAQRLAHYMVPAFLLQIEALPLTLNGKIDRSKLPAPQAGPADPASRAFDAFELAVQAIWSEVLGVPLESVGEHSHFFQLGGHSLLATLVCNRVSASLSAPVKLKTLFEHPQFDAFCARARQSVEQGAALPPLVVQPGAPMPAPVASRLVRMMHTRALGKPGDNAYNIVMRVDFGGAANPLRLHQALVAVLAHNPIFNASFVERGGQLLVLPGTAAMPTDSSIPLESCDAGAIDARADAMRALRLPLDCAPLWRAQLLLSPQENRTTLLLCIHHAIFDGWSFKLLLDELTSRYEGKPVSGARLSWFDYGHWAPQVASSPRFAAARDYWMRKLDAVALRTELPFDALQREPNANRSLALHVRSAQMRRLKQIAEAHDMTLPPVLFALYLVWLWRVSGQQQLACAYPYAGRDVPGTEGIYGMFVSMVVLVQRIDTRQGFGELAQAVQRQMLDDRDHLLATPYDTDNSELGALNAIFSLQNGIELNGPIGEADYHAEERPPLTSKADLSAIFYLRPDGGLDGRFEYDSSVLHAASVERMAEVFMTLCDAAAHQPDAAVGELAWLSDAQHAQCLSFACGDPLADAPQSIPARFAEVVAAHASRVAVRCGEQQLSYRELDALSDAIARGVSACVPPGARIGLSMQKSVLLVASVLGVLKAGCAYVPLDPAYPAERLRYFVENCSVDTVLADEPSRRALEAAGLGELRKIDPAVLAKGTPHTQAGTGALAETDVEKEAGKQAGKQVGQVRRPQVVGPEALAYVIHTSGSTGKPKGVLVEHHSVVRMVAGASRALGYAPGAVSTLAASTNFDASVLDLFLALLHGGTLIVLPEEARRDPLLLHRLLKAERVTHTSLAPVVVQSLPREPLPDLQLLGFGGDTLDEPSAAWWSEHTQLFSLYGPTEITVMASCGQVLPGGPSRIIGKPLPGYRLYLLNAQRQLAPLGTVGEIYIGGENLARGYINQSAMTMERFVVDPFRDAPYALMYRTGDLGRFLADGTIEYFGRNDAQIKLRGFRIELGEIENCIAAAPGVAHAACRVWGEGEARYLAAYYVAGPGASGAALDEDALRRHVAQALPDYMVPACFIRLDALPASPNGKHDRKALPAPSRASGTPPREGVEQRIAEIWQRLLRASGIGRDDSFFRLGGNSILAVRMQGQLRDSLGIEFQMAAFYRSPTIAALADGGHEDMIERALADAAEPFAIEHAAPALAGGAEAASIRTMLLTGASGFLGIYLLHALCVRLDKVVCLQRCASAAAGLAVLQDKARAAGLAIDFSRVEVIPTDLAAPQLGLDSVRWLQLAAEVDAILHCGAFVHHLHSYEEMKRANVGGTETLLRLALTQRQKPFCFISTLSVGEMLAGAERIDEHVSNARPLLDNGYLLTKWVGEQRVAACARRFGLPAVVARPGNITGDSRTGFSNFAHNHFWLFNKGCLQLGAYPETAREVEMLPVDLLASAVTAVALHPRSGIWVVNLNNPLALTQRQWFAALAACGLRADPQTAAEWQRRLADLEPSNGLALIRDFYTGDLSAAPLPIEQIGTVTALARYGVDLTVDYDALVRLYVGYLRAAGFLEPVSETAAL